MIAMPPGGSACARRAIQIGLARRQAPFPARAPRFWTVARSAHHLHWADHDICFRHFPIIPQSTCKIPVPPRRNSRSFPQSPSKNISPQRFPQLREFDLTRGGAIYLLTIRMSVRADRRNSQQIAVVMHEAAVHMIAMVIQSDAAEGANRNHDR
ncbi:hypothetical protein ACVWZA_000037 [Sphingomonas sp. UYAg733]